MPPVNRRSFVRAGALLFLGTALVAPGVSSWAAAPKGKEKAPRLLDLALGEDERAALLFVQSYATAARIAGGAILHGQSGTAPRTIKILACVEDLEGLYTALSTATGFGPIYSAGNVVNFTSGSVAVTVEHLLPALFEERLADLRKRKRVTFAHDALTWDPVTRELSDPFQALSAKAIRILTAGNGLAAALDTVLRSILEAEELGLKPGVNYALLRRRVLNAPGGRARLAPEIVQTFIDHLATLADVLSPEKVEKILASRFVKTALKQALGRSPGEVLARYQEASVTWAANEPSSAALWLASLLERQIEDGTADAWIPTRDRRRQVRSRAALTEAREMLDAANA